MGLFEKILGNRQNNADVSPIQLSDWLLNINDMLLEESAHLLNDEKNESIMLVYFTLLASNVSVYNILHIMPKCQKNIGYIYREYRVFYECLWQIALLNKFATNEDKNRISKLYAIVDFQTAEFYRGLFKANPKIEKIFGCVIDKNYRSYLIDGVIQYINKEGYRYKTATADMDWLQINSMTLLDKIINYFGLKREEKLSDEFYDQYLTDIVNSTRINLLVKFDLNKCFVLELPDEFYK